jgi:LysM repeat protein
VVEFASPFPTSTPTPPFSTATLAIISNATSTIASSACVVTQGSWTAIVVGPNDTLYSIAEQYNTTVEDINVKNCLYLQNPAPGTVIYVPAVQVTKVVVPCYPPAGWVKNYVVKPGDTLYRIALSYGITYPQLQAGNCMGSSTVIFVGQTLWVPNVPTLTPVPLPTITQDFSTPTLQPTATIDFSTPTLQPTATFDFSTPTVSTAPSQ